MTPTAEDRERLRVWLDRRPPAWEERPWATIRIRQYTWRDWFVIDEHRPWRNAYLGERSARTGPDGVGGHACGCEQCAFSSTLETEESHGEPKP